MTAEELVLKLRLSCERKRNKVNACGMMNTYGLDSIALMECYKISLAAKFDYYNEQRRYSRALNLFVSEMRRQDASR